MWDEEPGSDFAEQLGKCSSSLEFISKLTETSNVTGPKPGRVRGGINDAGSPVQPDKRIRLSLSAEVEEDAEDCLPYQEVKSKSVGNALN